MLEFFILFERNLAALSINDICNAMCFDQLTSPFMALTDFLSALWLPLGLVPLIFILPILILYELLVGWARDDNEEKKEEK